MTRLAGAILCTAFLAGAACSRETAPRSDAPAATQRVASGPVSVVLSVDRERLTTAEQVRLTLSAKTRAGAAAELPEPPAEMGDFSVAERISSTPLLEPDGALTTSKTWVLDPFLPGSYSIPSLEVTYIAPDGAQGKVQTQPIAVEVVSVLPEEAQDTDELGAARGVVDPAVPRSAGPTVWLLAAFGICVTILAAALLLRARRRRRSARPDPCTAAERRLRELQLEPHASPAATIEEVSYLVRQCLAHRLDPMARTRTTDELIASPMLASNLTQRDLEMLTAGLRASDAAKFARVGVTEEQARAMMSESLSLVRTIAGLVIIPPPGVAEDAVLAAPAQGASR